MAIAKKFKLRVQKVVSEEDIKDRDRIRHRKSYLNKRLIKFGTSNTPTHFSCHNGFKLPREMTYTQFSEYFILRSKNYYLERIPCECNICEKIFGYSKKKEWSKQ